MESEFDFIPEKGINSGKFQALKKILGKSYKNLCDIPAKFLWMYFCQGDYVTGDMLADENGTLWTFIDGGDSIILNSAEGAFVVHTEFLD
ncbi:MAG TPA: hypothetical protein DF712_23210 [Balneola sp.]|nr:hypothetical protein [Balneola sp.]|tara:strand:- start:1468 stop:1737 length:270 start_codon:yes stop_codon:yes gene_type:complete